MRIGAVVLAAGGSSRLGQPKQLLQHRDQSFVRRMAETALAAGCSPVAVVIGPEQEKIKIALRGLPARLLPNDSWQHGIGTSVRAGVAVLQDCDALLFLACDQPHVETAVICRLIARQQETQKPMVASAYSGTLGVPAMFSRTCFKELLALSDQEGAKALLMARPNDVATIDFPEGAIDIDTPTDWQRFTSNR